MRLSSRLTSRIRDAIGSVARQETATADKSTASVPSGPSFCYSAGDRLGDRFTIVRPLGQGGMGEVYEARDEVLGENIALKTIRPELAGKNGFSYLLEEVRTAKRVTHPNVCRIHDVYRDEEASFFVTMELLHGATLSAEIQCRGGKGFPLAEALPLLSDMAAALDAAHAAQIIHRDFKPGNVMIVPRDGQRHAVVMDFGLAKRVTRDESGTHVTIAGTPGYMAPEQREGGDVTTRSDVYSLGVVIVEMLTGRRPAVSPAHKLDAALPPRCRAVIRRCLEIDPRRRYATAGEAVAALAQSESRERPGRRAVAAGSAAVVTCVVLGFAVMRVPSLREPTASPDARRQYEIGLGFLRDGTYYQASKVLQRAVAASPDFGAAHVALAEAWLELDLPEQARAEAKTAETAGIPPGSAERSKLEALKLTLNHDHPGALQAYQRIVEEASNEEKPPALIDLGRAAEKRFETSRAIECYKEAARLGNLPRAHLMLGSLLAEQGSFTMAAGEWMKAEESYEAASNLEGKTEVYYQRYRVPSRQEAKKSIERALETAKSTNNIYQRIRSLSMLSNFVEDTAAGEKLAGEALELAVGAGIQNLRVQALLDLANAASRRGDRARFKSNAEEALRLARQIRSERLEASAHYLLADAALRNFDPAAEVHALKARDFYQRAGFVRRAMNAQTLLARYRRDRREFSAALSEFEKILTLARSGADLNMEASAHHDIGRIQVLTGRHPEALDHYRESLRVWTAFGATFREGTAALSAGNACWRLGRYDEANEFLNRAAAVAQSAKQAALAASIARARAEIALSRNRFTEAIAKARECRTGTLTADSSADIARILCDAHTRIGPAALAKEECARAESLAETTKDPDSIKQARLARIRSAVAQGTNSPADLAYVLDSARAMEKEGNLEWQWRTAVLAGTIYQRAGRGSLARAQAVQAVENLAALEQRWGSKPFATYAARPDLKELRAWAVASRR